MSEISQRELRNDSGRIMRAVMSGGSFVVTRNGEPVGELSPIHRHRFIPAETAVALFRNSAPIDYAAFRADLDKVADPGATPRA